MRRRGFSIIEGVIGLAILSVGLLWIYKGVLSGREVSRKMELRNLAENLASELLETFVSLSNLQLAGYLTNNPINAANPAYPLCAHINIIDRAASTSSVVLVNPDPIANTPSASPLQNSLSPKNALNRFYRVEVVDGGTLAINAAACGKRAVTGGSCGVTGGNYRLCANERFLVTVGVTFVPPGKNDDEVQRISLASLLPEA